MLKLSDVKCQHYSPQEFRFGLALRCLRPKCREARLRVLQGLEAERAWEPNTSLALAEHSEVLDVIANLTQ